jgi:hypothetical protein
MKSFPQEINVKNLHNFAKINNDRIINIIRNEIYETLIKRKSENEYIDLDKLSKDYCYNNMNTISKIITDISEELHQLGWKTKLSFGDTGLFIYSTEDPPTSCW